LFSDMNRLKKFQVIYYAIIYEREETMTLAIAVKYPFGTQARALESLSKIRSVKYRQAIIFLTDSRLTYPDHHYEDEGVKLFDIDDSTAIAYSGTENVAQHCVENLKSKIHNPNNKVVNVGDTFLRTYRFHKSTNDKNKIETRRLSFLLGKYLKTGDTQLVLLESPYFKHKLISDIHGIGDNKAYEEIKKVVVPKLDKITYTGKEDDYITIASNIIDAMRVLVIEKPNFPTIGGLIQFWVLDSRGITEYPMHYTHDPTGKAEWVRATNSTTELKTAKDRLNLGPDYLVR
jgi:hypothetical protein